MISQKAQHSLRAMLYRAIKSSPLVAATSAYGISPITDVRQISAMNLVVLTVSSYAFRLIFLLHFSLDEKTKSHFSSGSNAASSDTAEREFLDAIRECGNICCGNLNRDLVRVFPHVGMSTPIIIDARSAAYLAKLGDGYLEHVEVAIASGPTFHVSLCVNEFDDLDFELNSDEEEITGELKMF